MKTLYLVRHAKSSWKDDSLRDFDRPLNKRGNRDAPFMVRLLNEAKVNPDLVVSSPANRAISTARIFCENLNYPPDKLVEDPELYMAGRTELIKVVKELPDDSETVLLFSHNPGLTSFSNFISDKKIDNIPTCGIVKLQLLRNSWIELEEESCKQISFDYPKKYLT